MQCAATHHQFLQLDKNIRVRVYSPVPFSGRSPPVGVERFEEMYTFSEYQYSSSRRVNVRSMRL